MLSASVSPLAYRSTPYIAGTPAISTQTLPLLSIVICTLDEHEAIAGVLEELGEHLHSVAHEIIVVDDSPDERTARAVLDYADGDPRIRLLHRRDGSGLSSAAIAGWDAAKGRYLALMDGDGQHDPALIGQLLHALLDDSAEVAVASRYLTSHASGLDGTRHRMSRVATWLTGSMLGVQLADPLSGCFVMTREWFEHVRGGLSGLGFKILLDVVASSSRRPITAQRPTVLRARAGGSSKMDARVVVDLLALLLEKRSRGHIAASHVHQCLLLLAAWLAQSALWWGFHMAGMPLLPSVLMSVIGGVSARWLVALGLTPRLRRPSGHVRWLHWLRYLAQQALPALGNLALMLALLHAGANAPLAVLAGVLLAHALQYVPGRRRREACS